MFYKVKSITTLYDYILLIIFDNDIKKYYDLKPLFTKISAFKLLLDIPRFV